MNEQLAGGTHLFASTVSTWHCLLELLLQLHASCLSCRHINFVIHMTCCVALLTSSTPSAMSQRMLHCCCMACLPCPLSYASFDDVCSHYSAMSRAVPVCLCIMVLALVSIAGGFCTLRTGR